VSAGPRGLPAIRQRLIVIGVAPLGTRVSTMPLPQDIRPLFQDIQDTLVRSQAPWIQQSAMSAVKVLWVGRETGTWASLHHWKKGYTAPPHKHLAGAHAFIISGKLQVRNGVLNAGDYVYEPSGILHDATTALEDTTYLFICNGAVLFFDENGFTRYTNWEVMEKLRSEHEVPVRAEAAE
jgi:gentisate 1,2-dioxygenase